MRKACLAGDYDCWKTGLITDTPHRYDAVKLTESFFS